MGDEWWFDPGLDAWRKMSGDIVFAEQMKAGETPNDVLAATIEHWRSFLSAKPKRNLP